MGKSILITGATGFIGRVLLSYLKKDADIEKIYCIDNLCNSNYSKDDVLFSDPRISVEVVSVKDYVWNGESLDTIFHLASPVGPVGVLKFPGTMGHMIVDDTFKMANLALESGAHLIDISTSEVYGTDPNGVPQIEDLDKIVSSHITVRSEYAVAKLLCEIFLVNLGRTKDLNFNIVRPYNIISYGQQAAAGFVLPRFMLQAQSGQDITVYKPGTQKRTFTDVRDFVEALLVIKEKGHNKEIYNVGNPDNRMSILDFALKIKDLTNSKSEIKICDPQTIHGSLFEEAHEKIPNISRLFAHTGWKPTRSIDDIVEFAVNKSNEV